MSSMKPRLLQVVSGSAGHRESEGQQRPAGCEAERQPRRPTYWRSFEELEDRPEFREFLEREFAAPLENAPPKSPARRRFMQLMGASLALAGCRYQRDHILPHARRPEGHIPGEKTHYATSMDLDGVAVGLLATSYEGRPIKLEGNPQHPSSQGAASVFHQASVLSLYDPDRSTGPAQFPGGKRAAAEWSAFESAARNAAASGQVAVLAEASSSPTRLALQRRLLSEVPGARWVEYEAVSRDNAREGARLAFGAPHRTYYELTNADVIVALDADLLGSEPGALAYGRQVAARRSPEQHLEGHGTGAKHEGSNDHGPDAEHSEQDSAKAADSHDSDGKTHGSGASLNRIYVVESSMSPTGSIADHRLPLRASAVKAVAVHLDAMLAGRPAPEAPVLKDPKVAKFVEAVLEDLRSHPGRSVVVAGSEQPPEVHALCQRINAALQNFGATVHHLEDPDPERPAHLTALRGLVDAMKGGQITALFVLGGNPVLTAPADLEFASALKAVPFSAHLSEHADETSRACTWHVPRAHYLEAWGDGVGHDGTITLAQPLIAPLHGGRSDLEMVAWLLGDAKPDAQALVRKTLGLDNEKKWRRAIHDGFLLGRKSPAATPQVGDLPEIQLAEHEAAAPASANGKLEVVFAPDGKVYDGRWTNNGWLQELPESFSKLTWDNAVLISPKTAKALGIGDAELVDVKLGGKTLRLPALHAPGQAEGSLKLTFGYGRRVAGYVGGLEEASIPAVGVDTYPLRTSNASTIATGASVTSTGERVILAVTQHLHAIDQLGTEIGDSREGEIIREATLDQFKKHPEFAKHYVHHPPLLSLWEDPVSYQDGHKWGMAIDMNKCIGCNACVVACQAENNIPVVGKERVVMGREMHWMRIDRYYKGDPDDPEVALQPMVCQQCENAPCEQVCPVGATMHSSEGLNDMVYNRCIGTRYCSNNCPYKVRRFNYFNYHLDVIENERNASKKMVFNPEVTIRVRGVMEKCTFCVQRIQNAKIKNKNAAVKAGNPKQRTYIPDGTIQTACQQTCSTGAIVFGDLNDQGTKERPPARVVSEHQRPLAYALLGQLNNRPRNLYIARVKNYSAKLGPKVEHVVVEHHGGGHGSHDGHGSSGHGSGGHDDGHGSGGPGEDHGKPAPSGAASSHGGAQPAPHGAPGSHEETH